MTKSDPVEETLKDVTPTAKVKETSFGEVLKGDRLKDYLGSEDSKKPVEVPGIDPGKLSAKYGDFDAAARPQLLTGTFRVPVDANREQYEKIKLNAIKAWIRFMEKTGWRWKAWRMRVEPGMYPARDPATGAALLNVREFKVHAWFFFANPKPLRIPVDPKLLEPTVLRQ